tara:strand:+ start:6945 stop:7106 length:162 start_codon:yes stop_codon:yes gene_type:complete
MEQFIYDDDKTYLQNFTAWRLMLEEQSGEDVVTMSEAERTFAEEMRERWARKR